MAILKDKAYESAYSATIDDLVNKAVNREEFSYDPATDQAYQAYAKEYGRLGDQARENTLGDVAGNTGGLVSSYAVTAAQQAQNQYNQALTDKIPALMEAAYARYNDDFNGKLSLIGTLQGLDDSAYGRFSDQRDYDRSVFESDRNYDYQVGRDQVADSQWQQQFDYTKERDQVADKQWQDTFDYQKDRDKVSDSQWKKEYDLSVRAQEYEEKYNDEQAKYQKMLNSWQTLGYATDAVAKYFGVPKGTQTSDYKFSAAQLALQQAEFGLSQQKFAYQKAKDAADEQNEDKKRYEKIDEVKSTKISDLINNSGGTKEQKSQMKTLVDRISNAHLSNSKNGVSKVELKKMIYWYAGYDENGNRRKDSNGYYVAQKITDKQAQILLDRYL